jgi:cytochrome P450
MPPAVTLDELETDPHPVLARLRATEPVAWIDALGGWLVTRRDLAMEVMRDAATFTVDDPRFSTGQVVGRSMLTTDGEEHARHRAPFVAPLRLAPVRERFAPVVEAEAARLIDGFAARGEAELRRELAGPLAARVVTHLLGLDGADVGAVLRWYDAIVAATTGIAAGRPVPDDARLAVEELRGVVGPTLGDDKVSDAAVLMFGGIETTEGMIVNAIWHLLEHPDQRALVEADPGLVAAAVEESLRLEPAAAVVDRYATADVALAGARIARGDLVSVSLAAANRDPATFPDPDRFDVRRPNAGRHLAFAHGPHVCIGMHLARLEAHTAVRAVLTRLPDLALAAPAAPRGLVFRKPPELRVRWTA